MKALKNTKKQHKLASKQIKDQNQSSQVVKKSGNCHTQRPNKNNLLVTPVKINKIVNASKSGKEIDHKALRTQSKKSQDKTKKSKSIMSKGEMSTYRKPKNQFIHERDSLLNLTGTKQKSSKWSSKLQINRPSSTKPEEFYSIRQLTSNQIQKQGIKDNEKIKSLRQFIIGDSQKVAKMNRIRDDHIINQLRLVQQTLKKKQEQQLHEKEISEYAIKIEKLQKNHEIDEKKQFEQISDLQIQLNQQKTTKLSFSHKMEQYQTTLSLLQREASSQKRELELQKQENNIIRREKQLTIEKLRRSQLEVHQLENKISELTMTKTQLQRQLKKSLADKDMIKITANKALQIVRSQIKAISFSESD